MSPEERAKAVAERFAVELPSRAVPELERIVTSAIKRALGQQLREGTIFWSRSNQPGASLLIAFSRLMRDNQISELLQHIETIGRVLSVRLDRCDLCHVTSAGAGTSH